MFHRQELSFEPVLQYLERNGENQEMQEVEIGYGKSRQTFLTLNGVKVIGRDEHGRPILPPTTHQRLQRIVTGKLKLTINGLINTPGQDPFHRTALIQATLQDDHELVRALLDHGADPSVADKNGDTAFIHAAREGHTHILHDFMSLIHEEPFKPKATGKPDGPLASKDTDTDTDDDSAKALIGRPTQSDKDRNSLRVRLLPNVLEHRNIRGETVDELLHRHVAKQTSSTPAEPAAKKTRSQQQSDKKPTKQDSKTKLTTLEQVKTLVADAHRSHQTRRELSLKKDAQKEKSAEEKLLEEQQRALDSQRRAVLETGRNQAADIKKTEEAIQERRAKAEHQYDGFFRGKVAFFNPVTRAAAAANLAVVDAYKQREKLRNSCGLILFSTDIADEYQLRSVLWKLSRQHNYEPILIRQTIKNVYCPDETRYSIWGCPSFDWRITPLDQGQVNEMEMNHRSAMLYLRGLGTGTSVYASAENPLFASHNPEAIVELGHKPALNPDRQHQFKVDVRYRHPVLPASPHDQATVRAALSLLKDYYAPDIAPLPRFLECSGLRRLLTCHLGRRYSNEAERLYRYLDRAPTENISDIMEMHRYISAELIWVKGLKHDKNENNTLFNSSYLRRLHYIRRAIESTPAYQFATSEAYQKDRSNLPQEVDTYLGHLDIKYRFKRSPWIQ